MDEGPRLHPASAKAKAQCATAARDALSGRRQRSRRGRGRARRCSCRSLATLAAAGPPPSSSGAASTTSRAMPAHAARLFAARGSDGRQSVRVRRATSRSRPLATRRVARGALCYRDRCEECHGGPASRRARSVAACSRCPARWSMRRRRARAELYWITRNGIKMSGMPAWATGSRTPTSGPRSHSSPGMPALSPAEFRAGQPRAERSQRLEPRSAALARAAPDPARGRTALTSSPATRAT